MDRLGFPSLTRLRPLLLLGLLILAGEGARRIVAGEILGPASTRASDALPLYLSAGAVSLGLDPTEQSALARVYDERGLQIGAATFSTLYPATAGALLRPAAALDWDQFSMLWRSLLLVSLGFYGVAAAWLAEGSRIVRLCWGAGVAALLLWHPVSAECVRLGQVNMLLGALCALGIAAVRRGPEWAAGPVLAVGALIKLVPGALIFPVLVTRRWRAAVGLGLVGLAGLGLCLPTVPISRIIEGIRGTLAFQGAIDPDWLVGRSLAPGWMRWLGFFRHEPAQWMTLGAALLLPALHPSREVVAAAMALLCAWLGADASGFHVLYVPLAFPALIYLGVGSLFRVLLVALLFYGVPQLPGLAAEPRMVLVGLGLWLATMVQLLRLVGARPRSAVGRDPVLGPALPTLAGLGVGWLLAHTWPEAGPVAPPLAEGQTTPEGPGFIRASDRVPGLDRALGAGLDRPASTLAKPGTIRAVQLYLRRAPLLWGELAERYPARTTLMRARASAAPGGELRALSGREVGAWLREEQATVEQLQKDGLELGVLPSALQEALSSGLGDPNLSVPEVPNPPG